MLKKFWSFNKTEVVILSSLLFVNLNSREVNAQQLSFSKSNGKELIISGKDQRSIQTGQQELAPTSPMGWNTWNWFGKTGINEKIIREVIDAMARNGLRDAGYEYIVVDGGWRDNKLGPNGELLANPIRFPHGMKVLADYAHSNGFKFGLHTVPGTNDCGGDKVGGYGHEKVQIQQFVDWGIDFIKLDKCRFSGGWNEQLLERTYRKWATILKKSGRNIVLSISAYQFRDWNPEVGNMSRTTGDIGAKVNGGAIFDSVPGSVMHIAEENNKWAKYARPGYWNDPDMLATGDQGLTPDEQKIHFALWGIMSAPLFLGDDPRKVPQYEKDIILNKEAIAIDQDTTGQGVQLKVNGDGEIWAKKLGHNKVALLLFNKSRSQAKNIELNLSELGIHKTVNVTDVYAKRNLGKFSDRISYLVKSRSCLYMVISQ
ncbi:glycoside hydrolase family 27 protein [Ginsengibacter hankyongi]|nr:glycoside hydrolase family 27 protein [Ginsengibacter hankyongi]